jgi:hypothetical protein
MNTDEMLERVRELKDSLRSLDTAAGELGCSMAPGRHRGLIYRAGMENDAIDHLQQVHYLLTSAKGHLSTVGWALKQIAKSENAT